MALLQEKLYQSESLSRINMAEYFEDLKMHLVDSFGVDSGRVDQEVAINDIYLAIDEAIPVGLTLTELLSNALKYACPGDRKGTIRVDMTSDDGTLTMRVADGGVGLDAGGDVSRAKTLGLSLVNNLVHQLEGTLDTDSSKGVGYTITFDPAATP